MKICIVTLYKTINSGSYWQARALGSVIEEMGHSVYYFNVKYKMANMIRRYAVIPSLILKGELSSAFKYISSLIAFKKAQTELDIINDKNCDLNEIDYYVLGSDTIWNLDSDNLIKNMDVFWGSRFKNKHIVTYAGSVANTTKEKINHFPQLIDAVNSWEAISVRDQHTYEIMCSLTNNQINFVCDPTLLLGKSDYKKFISNKPKGNYIFLYLFDDLSHSQIKEIREFANENNLKIIQGTNGYKFSYSDEMIVNSPYVFLEYMMNAEYIITDTFHGTVFSVNLEKQFVVINRGKNKVNDFLNRIEFLDRLIETNYEIKLVLSKKICYKNRMQKLDAFRKDSLEFLMKVFNRK